jgi:hypothetical protein
LWSWKRPKVRSSSSTSARYVGKVGGLAVEREPLDRVGAVLGLEKLVQPFRPLGQEEHLRAVQDDDPHCGIEGFKLGRDTGHAAL